MATLLKDGDTKVSPVSGAPTTPKEQGTMSTAHKDVASLKEQGTVAYKAQKFLEAISKYREADLI